MRCVFARERGDPVQLGLGPGCWESPEHVQKDFQIRGTTKKNPKQDKVRCERILYGPAATSMSALLRVDEQCLLLQLGAKDWST